MVKQHESWELLSSPAEGGGCLVYQIQGEHARRGEGREGVEGVEGGAGRGGEINFDCENSGALLAERR